MIDPSWIAGLGVILFGVGLIGVFTRNNAIVVLMCIEVMLNAANLNFVAGTMHYGDVNGWVFTAIASQLRLQRLQSVLQFSSHYIAHNRQFLWTMQLH